MDSKSAFVGDIVDGPNQDWTGRLREMVKDIRRIIGGNPFGIATEELDLLNRQLGRLDTRLNENRLRIALIGAFSSGKSTFINALLKQKILKAGMLATTAAVTEISNGPNDIVVEMSDGTVRRYSDSHDEVFIDTDFKSFLEKYQAEDEFAKDVTRLRLTIDKDILDNDAVILDTPGFNSDRDLHQSVIERVLADEADAGVFLFSSQFACDEEDMKILARFRDKLRKVFFVVTKRDLTDRKNETDAVVQNVKHKIQKEFDLPAPPQVAAVAQGKALKDPEGSYGHELAVFEQQLFTFAKTRKQLLLTEGALSVLDRVIDVLKARAEAHDQKLTVEKQRINGMMLVDPDKFISENKEEARSRIKEAGVYVRDKLNCTIESTWNEHERYIVALVDEIRKMNKTALKTEWKNRFSGLQKAVITKWEDEGFKRLEIEANKIAREFEERFVSYYKKYKLPALLSRFDGRVTISPDVSPVSRIEDGLFKGMLQLHEDLNGWFADIIDLVRGNRKKFRDHLISRMQESLTQVKKEIETALGKAGEQLIRDIVESRVNEYAVQYTQVIHTEVKNTEAELLQIQHRKDRVVEAMKGLDLLKKRLNVELENLHELEHCIQEIETGHIDLNEHFWAFTDRIVDLCLQYNYSDSLRFLLEKNGDGIRSPAFEYIKWATRSQSGADGEAALCSFFNGILEDQAFIENAVRHLADRNLDSLIAIYPRARFQDAPIHAKVLLAKACHNRKHLATAMDLHLKHMTHLLRRGSSDLSNIIEKWRRVDAGQS